MNFQEEDPKVKPKKKKDLIADLDWWSKYYVTKEDFDRVSLACTLTWLMHRYATAHYMFNYLMFLIHRYPTAYIL